MNTLFMMIAIPAAASLIAFSNDVLQSTTLTIASVGLTLLTMVLTLAALVEDFNIVRSRDDMDIE